MLLHSTIQKILETNKNPSILIMGKYYDLVNLGNEAICSRKMNEL
jgi:hypothetical protein